MTPNTAEDIFEAYCQNKGLLLERIPEKENARTPDYVLNVAKIKIVIEVKESGTGPEKRASEKHIPEINGTLTSRKLGKWVQKKIGRAGGQIRSRTEGKHPGMLVLFNGGQLMGDISPTDLTVAMLGMPTYISAVAVLWMKGPSDIHLHIYHNRHADVHIHPSVLAQYSIPQKLCDDDHGWFDYEP